MASLLAHARFIIGALALVFVVAVAAPVSAQQPSSVNPTASSVKEEQLLQELNRISGPRLDSGRRRPARSSSRPAATGARSTR